MSIYHWCNLKKVGSLDDVSSLIRTENISYCRLLFMKSNIFYLTNGWTREPDLTTNDIKDYQSSFRCFTLLQLLILGNFLPDLALYRYNPPWRGLCISGHDIYCWYFLMVLLSHSSNIQLSGMQNIEHAQSLSFF